MQVVAAVCNMALQHHEFELRLRDAERLRLYVQAGMAEREMQGASLKKAELACRHLELEARESVERAIRAEAERYAARHKAAMTKLVTEGAVNTRAQIESELARVQRALAVVDEARQKAESEHEATREALTLAGEAFRKAEEESGRLANEILSLVMELGAVNDEFTAFQEKAAADREIMEAEFDSSGDTLFNYGYGCCVFMHNICGSRPHIQDGMLNPFVLLTPEFFVNPRCLPSVLSAAAAPEPAKEHPETSPIAAGEEMILPMDPSAEQDTLAE